jgi:hypothetical protein
MKLVLLIGLVLALAGLGLVARKRQPAVDHTQLESARTSLGELAARESRLLQDKERLLGRQLHNVDPLAEDVRDLTRAREQLEPLRRANWLDAGERALVAGKLDECQAALRAQEASVDALKTYSAFERNSADNFPLFADALAKTAPRALQDDVRKLHLMVAEFRGEHRDKGAEIQQAAEKLRDAAKTQQAPVSDQLVWLAGHAQIIVEAEAELARHRAALEQPEAQRAIGLLDATFERTAAAAAGRTQRARNLVLGLGGTSALFGVGLVVVGLRKRSRA